MCQDMSAWTGLPQVRHFGVFFVVKEVGSRGGRAGPEAPEPPEVVGSFCLLVSRIVCDPVGGAIDRG